MTDREIVIDLLSKLPEDTSLEEIAREIELLAGINDEMAITVGPAFMIQHRKF